MKIAMALPIPYSILEKMDVYIRVLGTSLACSGPPFVKTQIRSNSFSDPMTAKVKLTFIVLLIKGIVTCHAICRSLAPSICAAS